MPQDLNNQDNLTIGREMLEQKKLDTFYDKAFVKYLVKEIQKLSGDIGAVIYGKKMVVFFWRRIIFYKVILDETNLDKIKMDEHIKRAKSMLNCLKSGLVPIKELSGIKREATKINFKSGKRLI